MSDSDSSELCSQFIQQTDRYFVSLLTQLDYSLVDCQCAHGGRECVAMYESAHVRLLLELSDGSFKVYLGKAVAPFPGLVLLKGDGSDGWYPLFHLVGFMSGTKVYSEDVVQGIWSGELDPYQFEADLLATWANKVLPLFAPEADESWQEAFSYYYASLLSARKRRRFGPLRF